MFNKTSGLVRTGLLLGLMAFTQVASADLNDLLRQIPADSNGLMLIHAKAIQEMAPDASDTWLHGPGRMDIPRQSESIVMATRFDLQHMEPLEQMVAVDFLAPVKTATMARTLQGYSDRIGTTSVVWLERGCLFVNSPQQVTLVSPVNRQSAARWIRRVEMSREPSLSSYLAESARDYQDGKCQFLFALDLRDILDPATVKSTIEGSELFKDADRDEVTSVLASLQGLSVQANLATNQCRVSFSFEKSTELIRPVAKQLISAVLKSAGAGFGDLQTWEITGADHQIEFLGPLKPELLQRIISLNSLAPANRDNLDSLTTETAAEPPAAEPEQPQVDRELERQIDRSRYYFRSISSKLRDLQNAGESMTFNQAALWINNYAKIVDALPTSGVDPELVKYGQSVVRQLQDMLAELNLANDRAVNQSKIPNSGGPTRVTAIPTQRFNYGGHIRYRYAPVISRDFDPGAKAAAYQEEVQVGNDRARTILDQILQSHYQMGQWLSEKYGTSFE